jgi:hypothetical protein
MWKFSTLPALRNEYAWMYDNFVGVGAFVLVAGLAWWCVRQSGQGPAGQRHAPRSPPLGSGPPGARCTTRQLPSGRRHRDDDLADPRVRACTRPASRIPARYRPPALIPPGGPRRHTSSAPGTPFTSPASRSPGPNGIKVDTLGYVESFRDNRGCCRFWRGGGRAVERCGTALSPRQNILKPGSHGVMPRDTGATRAP